jgi:hypothetical protein
MLLMDHHLDQVSKSMTLSMQHQTPHFESFYAYSIFEVTILILDISIPQISSSHYAISGAAAGTELLKEIGENSSFALFGYRTITGIALGYVLGFSLSTFTTFATILGRYNYGASSEICSCCSVLEQDSSRGFFANLLVTFKNFISGINKMPQLNNLISKV